MPKKEDWVPAEMPEGSNPEEFMNDEALAAWLSAKHESMDADDPEKSAVAQSLRRAKLAAAITAAADPDAV